MLGVLFAFVLCGMLAMAVAGGSRFPVVNAMVASVVLPVESGFNSLGNAGNSLFISGHFRLCWCFGDSCLLGAVLFQSGTSLRWYPSDRRLSFLSISGTGSSRFCCLLFYGRFLCYYVIIFFHI
mgnify:CR=1 FL=1